MGEHDPSPRPAEFATERGSLPGRRGSVAGPAGLERSGRRRRRRLGALPARLTDVPRPRSLTEAQIAAAALAVLDRDGLDGLTMRTVAEEIGVSTMALYRYVDGREHLESLIVDRLLASVDLTPPAATSWRERVVALCERARAAIEEHPAAAPLVLSHRHTAPGTLRFAEALLEELTGAGFTGGRRVVALRALLAQLFGSLMLARFGPLSGSGTAAPAALPEEEFPLLADTARHARRLAPEEEFRRSLELVLRGMSPR